MKGVDITGFGDFGVDFEVIEVKINYRLRRVLDSGEKRVKILLILDVRIGLVLEQKLKHSQIVLSRTIVQKCLTSGFFSTY